MHMKMTNRTRRLWKIVALCGTLALTLALSGCYFTPDEITSGTESLVIGSDNVPFDTVAPVTARPTNTPYVPPVTQPPAQPTVNWDNWGPTGNTASPATTVPMQTPQGIIVVTQRPTETPDPNAVTPVPAALKKGMDGELVRDMQRRLRALGYLNGSVDGDFGAATETAVKAFQAANGLTADGVAGSRTLQVLNSDKAISYAKSKQTATPRVTKTPRPTATPNLTKDKYITFGSPSGDVRTLQNRLIQLGWMDGKADGEFGGATQAAVIAFQDRSGLWDDGIAGPDTLKKLYSSSAAKTSTPVSSVGETLKQGSSGSAVRALQKRLKTLGYYSGSVDGDYGSGTVSAVKTFQAANGLTADGAAGTATLNKIYRDTAKEYSSSSGNNSSSTSGVSSTGYITLREGDESDDVRKLQQALKKKGYYSGSVDGKYGSGTVSAVMSFQRMNSLTVDGVAGPTTQRALYGTGSSISYATLREGDEGSAVTNLQYTLYELGYYDAKVDGKYGATTKDAVRAFQIRNSISPVDGVAGNKTLQRLYSSSAIAETASKTTYATLRKGDKGSAVVEMQDVLRELGYLAEITGEYDSATVNGVKAFQQYNGLTVDGVAGNSTLIKLYSDSAKPYPY